jgi:oligopeptide/dipeptide ABC transporter ATP-binding protein
MRCGRSIVADNRLVVDRLRLRLGPHRLEVLRDISFEVGPGGAFGLVGESGSGKSMACRSILRLLPASASIEGRITFGGTSLLDLSESAMRRVRGSRIAMIFQDPMSALNPVVPVGDAIAQVIRSHDRIHPPAAKRRAIEMMDRVGIRDPARRAGAYPHEFSGGMRQRIMIAMALATRPSLLLADEPTTALDVIVQAGILGLLDRLRREEGMSMLFVSHDLAVVAGVCDRVGVMYAGQIVEEGPTERVLFNPHMPYTIGLIDSVPQVGMSGRLRQIPGRPPSPSEVDEGCPFVPRCRLAHDVCRVGPIPAARVERGHWARCARIEHVREVCAPLPKLESAVRSTQHG